jgi:hypothetical protein
MKYKNAKRFPGFHSFSLAVSLWVIGRGERWCDAKKAEKGLPDKGYESFSPIRDDLIGQPEIGKHKLVKMVGQIVGIVGCMGGDENRIFAYFVKRSTTTRMLS